MTPGAIVMLPMSWWAQQGSNLWPLGCKPSALPLSYAPQNVNGRKAAPQRTARPEQLAPATARAGPAAIES
jgi:hypothetical protein